MNDIPISSRLQKEAFACPQCGSAWRVRLGLCLCCLLSLGLSAGIHNDERLDDAPGEIDMRDADLGDGNCHILEEIERDGMGVICPAND